MSHIPVLQKEVIEYLDPKPNQNFIDATIGEGGHALAILEKIAPEGKLLGIEWDPELISNLKSQITKPKMKDRLILACDTFANLKKIVMREKFENISGILFDLGLSSWHLEKSGRGFTFLKDEPLIMRYNWHSAESLLTVREILNQWPEKEISRILKEFGEEKFAKQIAKKIVETRKIKPIETTFQLVEIIKKATPCWYHHQKIHFATRSFQALRIVVNGELENIKAALPQAVEVLERGGRLVVISFHSLEDRLIKNFYKNLATLKKLKVLTKKPIRPSKEEMKINPRSRSAKLRAAIKI